MCVPKEWIQGAAISNHDAGWQDLGNLVCLFPQISKGSEELRTLTDEIIVLVKPSEIFILNSSCSWQLVFSYLLEVRLELVKNGCGMAYFGGNT